MIKYCNKYKKRLFHLENHPNLMRLGVRKMDNYTIELTEKELFMLENWLMKTAIKYFEFVKPEEIEPDYYIILAIKAKLEYTRNTMMYEKAIQKKSGHNFL
jgi:hypothetical protein